MTDIDPIMIPSVRYEIWGWPAVVNFVLGGTAASFYLFSLLDAVLFSQAGAQLAAASNSVPESPAR